SWSWAQADGVFRPTSPGWNSALGLGHDWLGFGGISLVGAVGILAYFALATLVARRLGARPLPTVLATSIVAMLALPMISPRATIVIEALLLATLTIGHRLVHGPLPKGCWTFAGAAIAGVALGGVGAWVHVSWTVMAAGLAGALPAL